MDAPRRSCPALLMAPWNLYHLHQYLVMLKSQRHVRVEKSIFESINVLSVLLGQMMHSSLLISRDREVQMSRVIVLQG